MTRIGQSVLRAPPLARITLEVDTAALDAQFGGSEPVEYLLRRLVTGATVDRAALEHYSIWVVTIEPLAKIENSGSPA